MLRILIVEDDEPKLQQIVETVRAAVPRAILLTTKSLNGACRALDEDLFDLVLLDMTLPTFEGGKTANASGRQRTQGGRDFLRYMWESEISSRVYVVSQFRDFPDDRETTIGLDVLGNQLRVEFPSLYRDSIYFEHKSTAWKNELIAVLKDVYEDINRRR
ncbi:MAG: hypothetical protein JSR41_05630 [Proteobacteria bacterium]|nr:hypothetical protein [Pseudomonadota bacterium]